MCAKQEQGDPDYEQRYARQRSMCLSPINNNEERSGFAKNMEQKDNEWNDDYQGEVHPKSNDLISVNLPCGEGEEISVEHLAFNEQNNGNHGNLPVKDAEEHQDAVELQGCKLTEVNDSHKGYICIYAHGNHSFCKIVKILMRAPCHCFLFIN